MMMVIHYSVFLLLIFLTLSPKCNSFSWGWFSSSSNPSSSSSGNHHYAKSNFNGLVAEFSTEALNDPRAVELLDNARMKLEGSNPCWFYAYKNLFSSCSEIFAEEEKRSRLAWLLSDCFQRDSGRDPFPPCNAKSTMVDCLRKLNNYEHTTYLEFYLETSSICHQLQSKAFKLQVESLVNDLKNSALSTEEKLETIEEKSDTLLHNSNQIQESIMSIDEHTLKVGENLKNLLGDISMVMRHSRELRDQAKGIASSQVELLDGQGMMKDKLEESFERVEESYSHLRQDIDVLQKKAGEVEEEINKLGEAMSSKLHNLQGKADDIADMAVISIEKQQQLLASQSEALKGLQSLTEFQSKALQESRVSLEQIVGFAQGQHQELKEQQEHLLQAHNHLARNSKSMLEAQEAFESKQANMFTAIDKLFALHNAMLLESRLIKAFVVYSLLIIVLYMLTSTKQTYAVRCKLFVGLCSAFAVECVILQFSSVEIEQQTRLKSAVKSLFGAYAVIQLLYSYITYRDYEALNHNMLASLIDKVNDIPKRSDFSSDDEDLDSEVDWISWMETELPEESSIHEDPDYTSPFQEGLKPGNSVMGIEESNKYNLRHRKLLKQ